MCSRCKSAFQVLGLLTLFAALGAAGCAPAQTAEQALNVQLKQAGKQKEAVFPLAGTVMIDGSAAPTSDSSEDTLVMLVDRDKLDRPPRQNPLAVCKEGGKFAFHTYTADDGVKPGTYVVIFVKLADTRHRGYVGPDGLHNLYNDPDVNVKEFTIEHQPPGKRDYVFNLKVDGVPPVEHPGPHALTAMPDVQ